MTLLFLPTRCQRDLPEGLSDPHAGGHWRPRQTDRPILVEVLHPQFHRVHVQGLRKLAHLHLIDESRLGRTKAPHGHGDGVVGEHPIGIHLGIGHHIGAC